MISKENKKEKTRFIVIDQRNCFNKKQCRIHRYLQVGLYCTSESITCINMSTTCFAIDYNVFSATTGQHAIYLLRTSLLAIFASSTEIWNISVNGGVETSVIHVCRLWSWHFWKTFYEVKPTRFVLFSNDEDYFFPAIQWTVKLCLFRYTTFHLNILFKSYNLQGMIIYKKVKYNDSLIVSHKSFPKNFL